MAQSQFDELLHKEVTRKQFLASLGGVAVAVVGLSAVSGIFTKRQSPQNSELPGYGMHNYGP